MTRFSRSWRTAAAPSASLLMVVFGCAMLLVVYQHRSSALVVPSRIARQGRVPDGGPSKSRRGAVGLHSTSGGYAEACWRGHGKKRRLTSSHPTRVVRTAGPIHRDHDNTYDHGGDRIRYPSNGNHHTNNWAQQPQQDYFGNGEMDTTYDSSNGDYANDVQYGAAEKEEGVGVGGSGGVLLGGGHAVDMGGLTAAASDPYPVANRNVEEQREHVQGNHDCGSARTLNLAELFESPDAAAVAAAAQPTDGQQRVRPQAWSNQLLAAWRNTNDQRRSAHDSISPPGMAWRAAANGVVPLAAVFGFSLTPSRYMAARIAGAVVLGIAANGVRQAAVLTRKRQAPLALLELVRTEGAGVVTRDQLVLLGEKYFVKEPELWRSSQLLYSSVLMDAVTDHHPDMDDLARLVALKDTLKLSPMDVAACHQQVVTDALSSVGPAVSMDKMIFLSERMFYQEGMTDMRYLDQCSRLRHQLGGMTQVELLRKVTHYAAPFYQTVLDDAVSRPESFSGEVLLRTRRRLGVSEVVAGGMHLDMYQTAIQRLLDTNGKLDELDRVWLARLRGIMGVSQFEGERALESVTAPVYRQVMQTAFAEAAGMSWGQPGVDALRAKLRARQTDLMLSMAAADSVIKETIRKLALQSLEGALLAIRSGVGGSSPSEEVLRAMGEVFRLKDAAALLVQTSPDADCSRYFVSVLVGSPSLRMTESEKRTIYRIHLEHALKDMRLDVEDKVALATLRSMLQLVDSECQQVYLAVANPLLKQRLAGMMEHGNFTTEHVTKLEEDLTVPHEIFQDVCMEVYHARLTKLLEETAGRGGSESPSERDKATLDSIAEALGLSREQLWTIHNITCGPYFTDAALELLKEASWGWNQGSRGTAEEELEIAAIQSEPVMMALESLRSRLGMSSEGARASFVEAFYEVVAPRVKQISVQIESLKNAREAMPIPTATTTTTTTTTIATPSAPTLPAAIAANSLRVNGGGGSKNLSPAHAAMPPFGDVEQAGLLVSVEASSREGTGEGEGLVGAAGKLEVKAAEIMDAVLGLAAFCEQAGAFKDLEAALAASTVGRSDPYHSPDIGQAVGPRAAGTVYSFLLEEAFSPTRDSIDSDSTMLRSRETLAVLLGLSKARVIDIHRGVASRLYLSFVEGKLERKWSLDATDDASLKAMEEALGMTRVVCKELLARGKKMFLRRKLEEKGRRGLDDSTFVQRLRQCAVNLGISLRDDLGLPEERRRRMFYAEAQAIALEEGLEATNARAAVEKICTSLCLPEGAVYDLYAEVRDMSSPSSSSPLPSPLPSSSSSSAHQEVEQQGTVLDIDNNVGALNGIGDNTNNGQSVGGSLTNSGATAPTTITTTGGGDIAGVPGASPPPTTIISE